MVWLRNPVTNNLEEFVPFFDTGGFILGWRSTKSDVIIRFDEIGKFVIIINEKGELITTWDVGNLPNDYAREVTLSLILAQLDVALSTRASEATLANTTVGNFDIYIVFSQV